MLHLHNILRWVILILAVLVTVKAFAGMSGRKQFTAGQRKLSLFFMISLDVQLLVGAFLYFTGAWGYKNIENMGMGQIMKDSVSRYYAVEHQVGMLLVIILGHLGNAAAKKATADATKQKRVFWFTLIALILMLAFMPWPNRPGIGRPLLPGM